MSRSTSPLRLLDDALAQAAQPVAPHAEFEDAIGAVACIVRSNAPRPEPLSELEQLRNENQSLQQEVDVLRRRDEQLKFYMQRLDEEMRLAARLQQDFLPKSLPALGRVRFHTLFRPAGYVSGDLYDVMRLDEKHVGFYMADAVGHGMPAALLTMFMKNALITKEIGLDSYRLIPPGQTIARLNDALVAQNLSHATFATAIYGVINTETLKLTFARAGHPHPIWMKTDGQTQLMDCDGGLLGIFENEAFPEYTLQLSQGERVFIYSDGVEVAFCDGGNVDTNRWLEELEQHKTLSTEELLSKFAHRIDNAAGSLTPKDDLTMIILDVGG
jgi:phosphoserine phosphatase RsbU/P